jgi:molybdopterin-guanine dinucleotide biosynthesis protein A
MSQLIGVVLAGGEGKRMGVAKGGLEVGGRRLAERAAEALWPLCGSVLVSVAPGQAPPVPGFRTIEDAEPAGRGPLAGIARAFETTGNADLCVLACDYPAVGTDLLHALRAASRGEVDVVMPTDRSGRDHPLVAIWKRSAERAVGDALAHGFYRVGGLLADFRVRRLGPDELGPIDVDSALINVNTPADLDALPGGAAAPTTRRELDETP